MITVGFTLIGRGAWSGGQTYQRNMLGVMATELAGEVSAKLFLTPEQQAHLGGSFDPFLAAPAIVDARAAKAGEGRRAVEAIVTGKDAAFAALVTAHGVDVLFESAQWMGNRFPVPVVSWIPDFQHRRLPHHFSNGAWWRRDLGFRMQTSGKRVIMLSSNDACADCEAFYPTSRGKTAIVRFSIDLDHDLILERVGAVRAAYGLPDRFFYLPNQFWSHKNHAIVVEALKRIARSGELADLPPIVLTGRTEDPRDRGLYERLMTEVANHGLQDHFCYLGLIPYEDVFALNAAADHLINPSYFEGWSTTVEEAKALGTPMVLSDIPLHREQAPDAAFFEPDDAETLAHTLAGIACRAPRQREPVSVLVAQHRQRRRDYAAALLNVFEMARGQAAL
jgi:glycosyltransferase involved in cell wall biosynthesis